MPDRHDADDRRAELISGAIAGDLTAVEQSELDVLRASDPSIDVDIAELGAMSLSLGSLSSGWDTSAPSADLRDRIAALADDGEADTFSRTPLSSVPPLASVAPQVAAEPPAALVAPVTPIRRRGWLLVVAAAACIGIGAGGVVVAQGLLPSTPSSPSTQSAPTGPPGTLGAVEAIQFTGEPSGVDIDGALIAHTWGTETVLHIEGLTENDSYGLVLVTADGQKLNSGSFLGSAVAIDCEMNAAVMRASVASVQITDASGNTVASADLPSAS